MRPSASLSRLWPLLAGLALGVSATFAFRHFSSPGTVHPDPSGPSPELTPTSRGSAPSASTPTAPATPPTRTAAALLLPPRLAADEAEAALAAWLALAAPTSPDATPADFATQAAALRALLTVLPDEFFPRLLDALIAREGDDARRLHQIAFDIWNERSSADAARWAAAINPTKLFDARDRTRLARQAARTWARLDFDAAYAWASQLPDQDLSRTLSSALLAQLAATEPARALALARTGGPEFLQATQADLFNAWAEIDPAAAVQALGPALLETDKNNWRLNQALVAWAGRDARAAVDWILAQPYDSTKPSDSLVQNISWQVGQNPAALRPFADALLARSDAPGHFDNLSNVFRTWQQKDPDAALAWIKTLPDAAQRADLIERNIYEDSTDLKNPDRLLPFALELPPGPVRDKKISGLLANWARTDADAALAWLRTHDDPSLAVAADRVQGALVGALAATDPSAATAAWHQLPSDESRAAAIPALAAAWTKTDPAGAARWMLDQLPTRPNQDGVDFATLSPEARAEFQKSINAYHQQNQVFSDAASAWFAQDPLAALTWAEALPDATKRNAALNTLGTHRPPFNSDVPDPTVHAAVLAKITNPTLRDKVLANHIRQWMRSDLPAARAWIDSNDALSAEQAARLLTENDSPVH